MNEDDGSEIIKVEDLTKFVTECFLRIGATQTHSEMMADLIVDADLMGHRSHGLFRLDLFIEDGRSGRLNVHGQPKVEKESCATAWVNGDNALGAVVGNFCMQVGMDKAREIGAAIVVAYNSNNFGVVAHYSKQALDNGMICMAFTNSSPLMLVTRAKSMKSGTNPISLAAPALHGDRFLLDMATTVVAGGTIDMKYRNGESIPEGWAVNAACIRETNADVVQNTGNFLPLGSYEDFGSHKGTGLSLMVEILCGILGAGYNSHNVGNWLNKNEEPKTNVAHCFILIDPNRFAPNFEGRLSEFMIGIRNMEPIDPNLKVRVPGDKSKEMKEKLEEIGIWYPKYVIDSLKKISKELMLECVPFVPKSEVERLKYFQELAQTFERGEHMKRSPTNNLRIHKDHKVIDEEKKDDSSIVVQDSSDWLCPIDRDSKNLSSIESISKMSETDISSEAMLNAERSLTHTSETLSDIKTLNSEQYD